MTIQPTSAMSCPDDEPPIDEALWERQMTAVSLRNANMTFQQIGLELGVSAAQARRDVEHALRDYVSGQMDTLIAQHRSILADIRKYNYGKMSMGDKDAAKTILDGMTHEAKLLGMYAPTRVVTGVSQVEFSERFVELIQAVSPDTLKELLSGSIRRNAADHQENAPVDAEVVPFPDGAIDPESGRQGDGRPGPDEPEPAPQSEDGGGVDDGWSNL